MGTGTVRFMVGPPRQMDDDELEETRRAYAAWRIQAAANARAERMSAIGKMGARARWAQRGAP